MQNHASVTTPSERLGETFRQPRTPLTWLLAVSLAVHAAAASVWFAADETLHQQINAGPVSIQLTRFTAGTTASERAAKPALAEQSVPMVEKPTNSPTIQHSNRLRNTAPTAYEMGSSRSSLHSKAATEQPAATTAHSAQDSERSGSALLHALQSALIAHFDYPPLARRRGWEGIVQLGLRVEPDGQLSHVQLLESSGHSTLDQAALHSLAQVRQLPDVMHWLRGRHYDLVLPVRYQLIDS